MIFYDFVMISWRFVFDLIAIGSRVIHGAVQAVAFGNCMREVQFTPAPESTSAEQ